MEFDIIGSGSIGLLFAGKLSLAQYDVHVWTSTKGKAELQNTRGITLRDDDHVFKPRLISKALIVEEIQSVHYENDKMKVSPRYAILAVKQTHIHEQFLSLLSQLVIERDYDAVIALQNGCGHIEKLSKKMNIPILTAVTSEAAKRLDDMTVIHAGKGETWIGDELKRDLGHHHQKIVAKALKKAGFTALMSKNIKEQMISKLLRNAIINPLTALFDVTNGQLPQSTQRLALMGKLFIETKQILSMEVPSIACHTFEDILQLCSATANNTSSMRADILLGAVTEIAHINGAVIEIAHKHQLIAPLNNSLVHMIEALQPEH